MSKYLQGLSLDILMPYILQCGRRIQIYHSCLYPNLFSGCVIPSLWANKGGFISIFGENDSRNSLSALLPFVIFSVTCVDGSLLCSETWNENTYVNRRFYA